MLFRAVLVTLLSITASACIRTCLSSCLATNGPNCYASCGCHSQSQGGSFGGTVKTEDGRTFTVQKIPLSDEEFVEETFGCSVTCGEVCFRFTTGWNTIHCTEACGCGMFITEVLPPPQPAAPAAPAAPVDPTPAAPAAPTPAPAAPAALVAPVDPTPAPAAPVAPAAPAAPVAPVDPTPAPAAPVAPVDPAPVAPAAPATPMAPVDPTPAPAAPAAPVAPVDPTPAPAAPAAPATPAPAAPASAPVDPAVPAAAAPAPAATVAFGDSCVSKCSEICEVSQSADCFQECTAGFCPVTSASPSVWVSLFVSLLALGGVFLGVYFLFVRTIMLKRTSVLPEASHSSYLSL